MRRCMHPLLGSAVVLIAALATRTLPAQDSLLAPPPRPRLLAADADSNDARAYIESGLAAITAQPRAAAAYFHWAHQLQPDWGEPLYLEGVALQLAARRAFAPKVRDRRTFDSVAALPLWRSIDSIMFAGMARNPFLDRHDARFLPKIVYTTKGDDATSGLVALAERRWWDSIEDFARALREHPDQFILHTLRADAFYGLQKYDSAIVELQHVIDTLHTIGQTKMVPVYQSTAMLEYGIGLLHVQRSELPAARAAYQRAIGENIGFAMAHARLAGVDLLEGDTTAALGELELAVQLQPDDPALRFEYGYALIAAERDDDAVAQLERAIALAPDYAAPYQYLGRLADARGKPDAALARYEEFLARAARSDPLVSWTKERANGLRAAGAVVQRE